MGRSLLVACVVVIASAFSARPTAAVETPNGAGRPPVCSVDAGSLPVSKARLLAFGNYRGPPASRNLEAQRFFDQGLVFGWGFNFAEAVRSFRAASQFDPECALCRWAIAWALGPSINHDMQPADVPVVLDAILQARVAAAPLSRERALIDALGTRYSARTGADTDKLSLAYAAAMAALAKRYADDADIAVLAAEAAMNAHAYDYWRADGRPQSWTPQIIAWLDRALSLAPEHPGAHHYRIHLFEDSPQRERALASAEQLGTLVPMVGHLVHMPSHIFFRLGRYREAVAANRWSSVRNDANAGPAVGPYLRGLTQFAQDMSHAARGDVAAVELESLQRSSRAARNAGLKIKDIHRSSKVLAVADLQLQSAIATARNRHSDAVRFARAAVAAEDRLAIDDPPVWPLPSRHTLGDALLRADRVAEAHKVFSADLHKYPQNCIALAGLAAAERAQRSLARASFDSSAQTSAHLLNCPK